LAVSATLHDKNQATRQKEQTMNTNTKPTATITNEEANTIATRYIAIWNEQDDTRRRALIAELWASDASYVDPLMQSQGHAAIDAMIQAVQTQYAGLHFRPRNTVDLHNHYLRFSWELAPAEGAALAGGTDVATLAADGRLQSVVGFLDFVPETHS
jgi:hypothetical protein